MVVLCFSTPELGCHDIFAVGSRTSIQHSVEIGPRASTCPSKSGLFFLTTGINGVANGKASYKEYPPTDSGLGLEIKANTVYSVLIILDLSHSVIEYHNIDPSDGLPTSVYQCKIETFLQADRLRPFAVSHRLEWKDSINHGPQWVSDFFFPGTVSHCHQWQMDFPGNVDKWREMHDACQEQQNLALSVPGHSEDHVRVAMLESLSEVTRQCLSMLVQVTVSVRFVVKPSLIEMTMHGLQAQLCDVDSLTFTLPLMATEGMLLNIQCSVCRGQVTLWSYVFDNHRRYVPCSSALLPNLIGRLLPSDQECVEARASFWKRK